MRKGFKMFFVFALLLAMLVGIVPHSNAYAKAKKVKLNKTNVTLEVGDTVKLNLKNATASKVKWSTSDKKVATVSKGKVTAKSEGKATIIATYNSKNYKCNVTVKAVEEEFEPLVFSGTGDDVITDIAIPQGDFRARLTHDGQHNFIAKFYYGNDKYDYLLVANEVGNVDFTNDVKEDEYKSIKDGCFEISADGNWTITIEKLSDTIKGNIDGIGTTMTDYVIGKGGRQKIRLTHNGKRNFIVKLVESNSGEYDLLVNEIGEYDGNVLVNTTKGKKYYLVINADGEWSIEF